MVYITTRQSPRYKQLSIDDLLFGDINQTVEPYFSKSGTITYIAERTPQKLVESFDVDLAIKTLHDFANNTKELRERPREELYTTFYIPKSSGGLRRIDAPKDELKAQLYVLKDIFENIFGSLYHTSAFAYIKDRCTIDAIKRHQSNESKWFAKFDVSGFFPATTLEHTMNMLSMIYPFNLIIEKDYMVFNTILELGFLNDGLPQGTPLSPMLTNLIMIPIDHRLSNSLRNFNKQSFIYTRYADDFLISSKYDFKYKEIEKYLKEVFSEFNVPFKLNESKTRYGSSSGSNWNLGVMLNKDNEITVGHKRKKQLKTMLFNYGMDRKNNIRWSLNDIQVMDGIRSYYTMVEGKNINDIVQSVSNKLGLSIMDCINEDIKQLKL